MAESTFKTNPFSLRKLLEDCHSGIIKLPEFQRSFVWDEDRIKSLIASVSRGFPIGALMSLETGGSVKFRPRRVEGAPEESERVSPASLLLDGQQRMTSLYQATLAGKAVQTLTPNNKKVKRWFYIDMRNALDDSADREQDIIGVPEDRIRNQDFWHKEELNLSSVELEHEKLMFPVARVFDWFGWMFGFIQHWHGDEYKSVRDEGNKFQLKVLGAFGSYQVPVIELGRSTSREAVCIVFEKVNTGGKSLDAFELVTATYAADNHNLREDWYGNVQKKIKGRHQRFAETLRPPGAKEGILASVSNTDFLQAMSLFYTREKRRQAEKDGMQGKRLPAVTCNRQALLELPLEKGYKKYQGIVEQGFVRAAKFLFMLHIYRILDLPYQSQVIALAAVLADIGDGWENEAKRAKLFRWYWNGVFGELYGSAAETRIARDFLEVPAWLDGGPEPSTVSETMFRAERLKTMRTRLSAAYKGVNALLMNNGARDFRSGQEYENAIFFEENVDIHHIFPQDWCKKKDIDSKVFDSIINKTPLSSKTNKGIGGVAPSEYLAKLQNGPHAIERQTLDGILKSHLIDPGFLRSDKFDAFMADRQKRLLKLIEQATGKAAYTGDAHEEGEESEGDEDTTEAQIEDYSPLDLEENPSIPRETVLEVGSEGGSLRLVRQRNVHGDWDFRAERNETALYDLLSDEDRNGIEFSSQTGYVRSFQDALSLLDKYPWFRLHPTLVNPEFRDAILFEVKKRGGEVDETRWRRELMHSMD
ncbi:MAG: DUF262 domain-containing protein [Bryobacteraceae bacterium]